MFLMVLNLFFKRFPSSSSRFNCIWSYWIIDPEVVKNFPLWLGSYEMLRLCGSSWLWFSFNSLVVKADSNSTLDLLLPATYLDPVRPDLFDKIDLVSDAWDCWSSSASNRVRQGRRLTLRWQLLNCVSIRTCNWRLESTGNFLLVLIWEYWVLTGSKIIR